jgi:transposase
LDKEIFNYAYEKHKSEIEILMYFLGIGKIDALTLIAATSNFKEFYQVDKLASWLGVVTNVSNPWINSITG